MTHSFPHLLNKVIPVPEDPTGLLRRIPITLTNGERFIIVPYTEGNLKLILERAEEALTNPKPGSVVDGYFSLL